MAPPLRRLELVGRSELGGKTYAAPTASARRGTSIVDFFVRGTDNAVYHRYRNGSAWSSGWVSIGAPPDGAGSAPAAISNATGRIDLFVRAADSAIWQRAFNGSWGPWTSLGGSAGSAPAVASRGSGRLDLFVRGGDGQIYRSANDGAGWSGWSSLGGGSSGSLVGREVRVPLAERPEGSPELALRLLVVQ
jgi:hypothetical protein